MNQLNNRMHEYIANEQYDWLNNEVDWSVHYNEAEGYYWLGKIYQHGFGKEKDMNKAIECYQKASYLYMGDATIHLASLYFKGIGVEKDEQKAYELAELAANQNNAYGQLITGIRYGNDFDNTIDKYMNKAVFYVNLAYKNGLQSAKKILRSFICDVALRETQFDHLDIHDAINYCENETLGTILDIENIFDEVDEYTLYEQAKDYYDIRKAARRGVVKAMFDLASYYENNNKLNKAILKHQMCIEHNYNRAYGGLGRCYEDINIDKAIQYYKKAIQYGFTAYQNNIDNLLSNATYLIEKGEYARKNKKFELAEEYFNRAKEIAGNKINYYLGVLSYDCEINQYYREKYIYKSNFNISYDELKRIENYGKEKTFNYFLKASESNNAIALMAVAYCYYYGRGVESNEEKAIEYCESARENGFVSVFNKLDIRKCDFLQIIKLLKMINNDTSLYILGYLIKDMK